MKICKCLRTAPQIEMWLRCGSVFFSIGFMLSSEMVCLMSGRWNSFQFWKTTSLLRIQGPHSNNMRAFSLRVCIRFQIHIKQCQLSQQTLSHRTTISYKNRFCSQLPFSIKRILSNNGIGSNWCFPLDNFEWKNKLLFSVQCWSMECTSCYRLALILIAFHVVGFPFIHTVTLFSLARNCGHRRLVMNQFNECSQRTRFIRHNQLGANTRETGTRNTKAWKHRIFNATRNALMPPNNNNNNTKFNEPINQQQL